MDTRPGGKPLAATATDKSAPGACATSVQLTLAVLLTASLLTVTARSTLVAVQAGPPPLPPTRIELTAARQAELMLVPGVGPTLAERIIKTRGSQGRFLKVDDLRKVPGIGPVILERLRDWVYVSTDSPIAAGKASLPLSVEPTG